MRVHGNTLFCRNIKERDCFENVKKNYIQSRINGNVGVCTGC